MNSHSVSKAYFVSLGCPKNLVDSQVMLGLLEKDRYEIAQEPSDADVIIVNTCSFIQAAKEESIETILEMSEYKENGKCQALVVSGCLPQRYSADLEKGFPEVDLFLGTGQYHRVTELLDRLKEQQRLGMPLPQRSYIDQPAFIHSEKDPRMHTGALSSAYLKISEGCNRRCSFCIIPNLRGKVRSRSVESLVEEAKALAAKGVKELNLVAQDLTHYGIEKKYEDNLEKLLPELCKVEGIQWIRLHYAYPDQFSDELIAIIAREPKIVKYLDMPIQHTNDRILRLMGRRLTKSRLFDLIAELRRQIPEVVFRTSIIVGFPGETVEEFEELCNDLETLKLDHVGVFSYSKEEGTKAALLPDEVHPATRKARRRTLIELLQKQSNEKHVLSVGLRTAVMVEGVSDESELLLKGRMSTQAAEIDGHVLINDAQSIPEPLYAGDIVEAELTESVGGTFLVKALRKIG